MSLSATVVLRGDQESHQGTKRKNECVKSPDSQTMSMLQETPFQNLHLASQAVLERAQKQGRSKCPKCNSSRMFYCYTCYVPVEAVPTREIPVVKLPVKIDIIKHPNETDGKSTAVHAKLLAPDDVAIYTYPCIPDYEEMKHQIALIFPGSNSVSISDIPLSLLNKLEKKAGCKQDNDLPVEPVLKYAKVDPAGNSDFGEFTSHSTARYMGLKKIVFVDSTWNQTKKIITDERLQALLQIELKSRKTCFWRHQKGKPDTYLSTIEAIYYFLVDYHRELLKEKYEGQYDNLLFFYTFMYRLIQNARSSASKEGKDI
ncbi:tRNA-uridine aminocarboxypropyltransferase 1 isoform X2 [Heteronotia binoei]|nr:tRNA-uridine aminocarboxypropyltransferase 1 isoform X2 [Heteronotia binoei]